MLQAIRRAASRAAWTAGRINATPQQRNRTIPTPPTASRIHRTGDLPDRWAPLELVAA
ncbi:MAG: hypothetical protein AAFP69_06620 [Planctomycetota bacterium]